MPLDQGDYAPGRIFRRDGDPVQVHDQLTSATGGRYLLVSPPGKSFLGLMAEAEVRDDPDEIYEPVDDDEQNDIRSKAADGESVSSVPNGPTVTTPNRPTGTQDAPEPDNPPPATEGTDGTAESDTPRNE